MSTVTKEKLQERRNEYTQAVARLEEHAKNLERSLEEAKNLRFANMGAIQAVDALLASLEEKQPEAK